MFFVPFQVLKPLQVLTTILCSDRSVTFSCVLPVITSIINKNFALTLDDKPVIALFKATVVNELTERFNLGDDDLYQSVLSVASLLDPRFKSVQFLQAGSQTDLHAFITTLMQADTRSERVQQNTEKSALDFVLGEDVDESMHSSSSGRTNSGELGRYLAEIQRGGNEDTHSFWRNNVRRYMCLAELAKNIFAYRQHQHHRSEHFLRQEILLRTDEVCLALKRCEIWRC